MTLETQLEAILQKRRNALKLRRLVVNQPGAIDFSSNDFLGLAHSERFKKLFLTELEALPNITGSTGSRLLDGNSAYAESLEMKIARFHKAPTALIFNSGFDANVSLFSSVPQPNDVIIYDELIHASTHEGMRLARTKNTFAFRHSDLIDFEAVLQKAIAHCPGKNVFVAVESVYSMDGDVAPLSGLVDILKTYWPNRENGYIIVDEAHSTGVYGENGRGVVNEFRLEKEIFARLHTFGKSLASHGAAVLGSETLRQYLINYARPLIYSTFMPFHSLVSTKCAYDLLESGETVALQRHVHQIVERFRETIKLPLGTLLPSTSPIQGIVLNGNSMVRKLATYLNGKGFIVKPICSPTVPAGQERVRICLHGHNTVYEVDSLVDSVHEFFKVNTNNATRTVTLPPPTNIFHVKAKSTL